MIDCIDLETLAVEPLVVTLCGGAFGAPAVIPLGAIPGPPGPLAERLQAITFVVDGGGVAIIPGIKGDLFVPYDCTITGWTLIADRIGDILVDVEVDNLLAFPPTVADTIVAASPPILIAQQANSGLPVGWITSLPAQSVLRYKVVSALDVQRVTIALTVERT